jgi:GntR family transcriptional regulator
MFLRIDPNNGVPLGVQIQSGLRLAVATQRLRPGDRLPSARDLAAELRVNFHTVRKAFADLEAEGVLETRRGLGTFIAAGQRSGRAELRRVVRESVEALLGELAGGDVDHAEVRELWLEEWERRFAAARRKQP